MAFSSFNDLVRFLYFFSQVWNGGIHVVLQSAHHYKALGYGGNLGCMIYMKRYTCIFSYSEVKCIHTNYTDFVAVWFFSEIGTISCSQRTLLIQREVGSSPNSNNTRTFLERYTSNNTPNFICSSSLYVIACVRWILNLFCIYTWGSMFHFIAPSWHLAQN